MKVALDVFDLFLAVVLSGIDLLIVVPVCVDLLLAAVVLGGINLLLAVVFGSCGGLLCCLTNSLLK